jgi:hypothetical protein
VVRGCPIDYFTVPVTFKNEKGFVKLTGYEGSYSMNVSLEFRCRFGAITASVTALNITTLGVMVKI